MGGTFDPIHLGHLQAAGAALESLGLDRVSFVPASTPPHRSTPVASPVDRYAMVCLATAGHPSFYPDDLELRRGGTSYTVETLREAHRSHPGTELFLIVGSDNVPELPSWRGAEEIFGLCTVAVVVRPEEPAVPSLPPPARVERVQGRPLAVSATAVRERAARGEPLEDLVPRPVAEYIGKRGLYR
jgi:nicotinate-nucleotide adenylyltransferase